MARSQDHYLQLPSCGCKLRGYRRFRGLTQAELAKAIGTSRIYIILVETNQINPSVYHALKIAQILRFSVKEIFG